MSEEGPSYTFNGHREALYRLLEAAVRGEPGCPYAACGDDDDRRPRNGQAEGDQPSAYPSPFLWYDEIRPSDVDAYHAANGRRGRGRSGGEVTASLEGPLVGSIPTPSPMGPGGERSRRSNDRVVVEGSGTGKGGAAFIREGRWPAAAAASVGRPAGEAPGERQGQAIVPGPAGSVASRRPSDRCMCAAIPTLPPPSFAERGSCCPPDKAGGAPPQEERTEDGAAAAASTGSPSTHDVRRPKPLEQDDYCHPITTQPAAATAATTPPEPSQPTTQTMFLPGLPSQVLVSQQQGGDAGWEEQHPPEGSNESSQKGEHVSIAASECASSPSPVHPHRSAEEGTSAAGDSFAPAGGRKGASDRSGGARNTRPGGPDGSNSSCGSNTHPLVVTGDEDREQARSQQHDGFTVDGFTLALREFVGEEPGRLAQSPFPDGSGGESLRPPLKYVPTVEVLPSSWPGGQPGAVALLEEHLSRARSRVPGGYAVRALELACNVLRQPTVCVRARGDSGGGAVAGRAAAAADGGHHEVVGIAGFVWEILRADGGDGDPAATS